MCVVININSLVVFILVQLRKADEDSCTWDKRRCVSYPWEVYWCNSECSFFFQNAETGVAVWSLPSDESEDGKDNKRR